MMAQQRVFHLPPIRAPSPSPELRDLPAASASVHLPPFSYFSGAAPHENTLPPILPSGHLSAPPPPYAPHRRRTRLQASPQVYARVYDRLAAKWTIEAEDLVTRNETLIHKRAREDADDVDVDEKKKEENDLDRRVSQRVRLAAAAATGEHDSTAQQHQRQASCPARPRVQASESNVRGGGGGVVVPAADEGENDEEPLPLRRLNRIRSVSSPPDLPHTMSSTSSTSLLPRATSPAPYDADDHAGSTTTGSTAPRQHQQQQQQQHRRTSSTALVNVIKSFEVVLQYRALGWRILDDAASAGRRRGDIERRRRSNGY